MNHFDEMTCLLYLEGQLERPRAAELSAHAEGCAECRGLLRALERESRWLTRALVEEDETVPGRLLAPPARDTTPWGWVISFGLASAAAYTLWTGIIEPWRQQLSQAGFGGSSLLTILFFRGAFWKGWGDMLNVMELLAMLTIGVAAFGLLRHTWRRWTTIAVVLGAVGVALALPPGASAAEIRKASNYVLAKEETIKNDLIVTGQTVRIDGNVEGDLISFTQKLTVNGHVTGDVIAFAQVIHIEGPVDGNVRAFSNLLLVSSTVGRNLTGFVGTAEFASRSKVDGGMMLFSGDATLEGRLNRDLLGFIGRTTLNGYVGGNVRLQGGHLNIGPSAEIAGKAAYTGEHQPEVSAQAKLVSPLKVEIKKHRPDYASPRFYLRQGLRYIGALLFGLLLLLVLPGFFSDVVNSSRRYGISLGVGALALVVGVVLLLCSVVLLFIGVSAGVALVFLYLPAIYAAQVFVGTWLGERLLGPSAGTEAILGRLALGLLILRIVRLVPFLGVLTWLAVVLWGVGALLLTVYKRTRIEPVAAHLGAA